MIFDPTIDYVQIRVEEVSTQGNRIERVQSAHWLMHTEARVVRAKREEELDKRISMVVKVINSQVWPSYCPALYPPIV